MTNGHELSLTDRHALEIQAMKSVLVALIGAATRLLQECEEAEAKGRAV